MMLVKTHDNGRVLALCDSGLVGKKFEDGEKQIDVTERFYGGEEKTKEYILNLIENAHTINVVGEESVKFAIENNIISKDSVIYIKDVPCAMVFEL